VVDEIIAKGSVTRSTIGAAFKSVRRSGHDQGVLVNSVNADGPAAKAGLKPGDVIVEMNGAPVNARFPEEIPLILRQISAQPVGSTVALTYLRGGERASAQVVTERLLREKGQRAALRTWGLAASEITERMMISRRLDSREGAIVMAARSGGPAEIAEPPLRSGDVIREIDGKPVKSLDELVSVYKEVSAKEPLPEFVMIRFDRAGKDTLTLIKPRPDKPQDPPREIPKAWIGVATQPVLRDLATQMKLGEPGGFRVTRVYPGTRAAESEIKTGDVIVAINGDKMSPRGMQDSGMFQRRVRQLSMTEPARLVVMRGGERVEVSVAMERTRIGPDEALKDTNKDFELSVRELTFFDRDDNRWGDDVAGVMVMDASSAGWADQAGLGSGDLIQSINGTAVTDIPGYRKVMEQIGKDQPERVTFVVLRGVRTQFKFAEPEWKPRADAEKAPEAAKE
jgi:serine protease Do